MSEELMTMITRLEPIVGRRHAIHLVSSLLAALSFSDLDADEHTRIAHAVAVPSRVDAHVINNLAVNLASCKRLEDRLGPCEVLHTVLAQHTLLRRLLHGEVAPPLRKALRLLDADYSCAIGGYLIDMDCLDTAQHYFKRARKAAPMSFGFAPRLPTPVVFLFSHRRKAVYGLVRLRKRYLARRRGQH